MKTRQSIVAMVKAWNPLDDDGFRVLDAALLERTLASRGTPPEKLEWHLAWLLDALRRSARRLPAEKSNVARDVDDLTGRLRRGKRVSYRDYLEIPDAVALPVVRAQIALAQEALDRFLDVYAALAADTPEPAS